MDSYETFQWSQLAKRQKIYIAAAVVMVVVIVSALAIDKYVRWSEVREFENAAAAAKRDKEAALELAAETATKLLVAEEQLEKVEVKHNATKDEIKVGEQQISRSRAEYERAVRDRVPTAPSTDELCRQLAAAGHPCNPR